MEIGVRGQRGQIIAEHSWSGKTRFNINQDNYEVTKSPIIVSLSNHKRVATAHPSPDSVRATQGLEWLCDWSVEIYSPWTQR